MSGCSRLAQTSRVCARRDLVALVTVVSLCPGLLRAADARPDSPLKDRLQQHVAFLASDTLEGREAGSSGGRAASQYIVEQLTKLDLKPAGDGARYTQEFGYNYRNVLAWLPGADPSMSDEFILIGAHFDHVGYARRGNAYGPAGYIHNGADDNASGTAAVLEMAAALTAMDTPPACSILFAFWDAEEINLDGSEHWCRHPTRPLEGVRLVINVDMVGRLADEQVYIHGGRTADGLRTMLAWANAETDLLLNFSNAHVRDSDHYPFFRKRIPYLMIDTGRHADYHRPTDDVERLNLAGLERMTRMLLALAQSAADIDTFPPFRPECIGEARRNSVEVPNTELPLRLGVTWKSRRPGESLTIAEVTPRSAAERAGLLPGDTLLQLGDHDIAATEHVRTCVVMSASPVSVQFHRPGEPAVLSREVDLDGEPLPWGYASIDAVGESGVELVTIVMPDSPAEAAGLERGDRILQSASTADGLVLTTERQGRIRLRELHAVRAAQSVP